MKRGLAIGIIINRLNYTNYLGASSSKTKIYYKIVKINQISFCKFAASQAVLSPRFIGEESPGNTGRHAS